MLAIVLPLLVHTLLSLATATEPFALPAYLTLLSTNNPAFAALNQSGYDYALGKPGDGGVVSFLVVTAVQDHFMYRVYGGPASQCGYWWVLAPPSNVYPVEPPIDKEEYMSELFAICPEWNNATSVIRCSLPAGTNLVVGPGQTATCPDGTTLIPSPTILQANGNGCAVTTEGDQECAFSKTFQYSLQESPVVRTTATGSNGCKGVCVDNDEVDAGYYLATIVLSVVLAAVLMFVAVYFSTLASATSSPKEGTAVSTSEIVIDEEDVNASAVEEQQVQVEKE